MSQYRQGKTLNLPGSQQAGGQSASRAGLGDSAGEARLPGQWRTAAPPPREGHQQRGAPLRRSPALRAAAQDGPGRVVLKRAACQSGEGPPQAPGREEPGPCFRSAVQQLWAQGWATDCPGAQGSC